MKHDHQMFVKMPHRNPVGGTIEPKSLRRSPRFLPQKTTPEPEKATTLRKSPRLHGKNTTSESEGPKAPKSSSNRARSSDPSLSSARDNKDFPEKYSKKISKSDCGTRNCTNLRSESRGSLKLNNAVEEFRNLRRSPRFSSNKNFVDERVGHVGHVGKAWEETSKSVVGLSCRGHLSSGSSKSPRLKGRIEGDEGLRRSRRVSNKQNLVGEHVESGSAKSMDKLDMTDDEKAGKGVISCEHLGGKRERQRRGSSVGPHVVIVEGEQRKDKETGVSWERKRDEEYSGIGKGWTKEQELALQRAYFTAKPTPHFWKKVSELVPGKSAQDCFDKVHSDNLTPLQRQPRSRTKKAKSSPQHISLSASRLLKPMVKRSSCNKKRTRLSQKTVRHLLQKHYHVDQDYEADLFSVFEPNMDPSTQVLHPGVILSTPKQSQEKQGFLRNFRERSSSGHKKALSRFRSSSSTPLVSPPVLKQLKNKVLHEKYIDQLHCREARRKVASARAEKSSTTAKEDTNGIHVQSIDVVRAAKNALVSHARDVISQYRHSPTNTMSNSDFNHDDEEGEDGT